MRLSAFICTIIVFFIVNEVNATSTRTVAASKSISSTQTIAATPAIQSTEDQPVFTGDKKTSPSQGYRVSFLVVIVKTILSLLIIGFLIVIVLKFFFKDKASLFSGVRCINTLATHPLAPNKYMQIIEINNKIIVLGITDSTINLLCEITDRDEIDLIKLQCSSEPQPAAISFIDHLTASVKKMLGNLKAGEEKSVGYEKKVEFLKTQHDRLRRLEG